MQDKPSQPDARPIPPPLPPPEKSAAVGGASAVGRVEAKNAGYDVRSAPFEQKKAPEGKLPTGSEDPIQRSKPQELLQKAKDAAHNAPTKAKEAVQKQVDQFKDNPFPVLLTVGTTIAETATGAKLSPSDLMLPKEAAKTMGGPLKVQLEATFPKTAEKLHGAAGKVGEGLHSVKDKGAEALQNVKEKLNPPKDQQPPLIR
jgi:hypothetical protein